LILTAIVVGVATTALALALVVRIHGAYGSLEEDEINRLDTDDDMEHERAARFDPNEVREPDTRAGGWSGDADREGAQR
ncbi:MAG: NADH-quinone oxidoreductase subunit K, partial [Gammaproteobacteria bacterium]|nr:NADH-quinone oxidoreductase subunit K [Gammaproteobacteria bacterium]